MTTRTPRIPAGGNVPRRRKARPGTGPLSIPSLGIRVKSGWAAAILLDVTRGIPEFLLRRRLLLADPEVPRSFQPFHRGFGRLQTNPAVLTRLTRIVARSTAASFAGLIADCRARGTIPRTAALVVGSTIDPARITNEHIRAHAHEAQLFRSVLERAAARYEFDLKVVRVRDLPDLVRKHLGPLAPLRAAGLGKAAGRPWGADEKLAALAAWAMAVPQAPPRRRTRTAAGPRPE